MHSRQYGLTFSLIADCFVLLARGCLCCERDTHILNILGQRVLHLYDTLTYLWLLPQILGLTVYITSLSKHCSLNQATLTSAFAC